LVPHPPIVVKEIGKGEEKAAQKTIDGMQEVAKDIRQKAPGVILFITPHGPIFQDAIAILARKELKGDFSDFRAREVRFAKRNHLELAERIRKYANEEGIWCALVDPDLEREYHISGDLDHGVMVPMYFIDQEYTDYQIVHITYGLLPGEELYRFGMCVQKGIQDMQEDAVVIASGDLSHRLTKDAPAGYHPKGKEFDETLINSLAEWKIETLFSLPPELCRDAGECGLRSVQVMLGACDGYEVQPEVLSYEGPFGVGYGVAKMEIGEFHESRKMFSRIKQARMEQMKAIRNAEDEYVRLAREALETYVKYGKTIEVPKTASEEMLRNRAGVFVSFKKSRRIEGLYRHYSSDDGKCCCGNYSECDPCRNEGSQILSGGRERVGSIGLFGGCVERA